jgi:Tfp pilus assembly protein PilF
MRVGVARGFIVAAAGLVWLAGCETTSKLTDPLRPTADATAGADLDPTGSIHPPPPEVPGQPPATPELLGKDPNDDLSVGKKYFRQGSYGMAERHFRKAVELHPHDLESWVGLAASYDRLRRFDLADRAYAQAIKIGGPTAEILNNHGFSYMLRGDYRRARERLLAAQARDPNNVYVKNNLILLEQSARKAKAVN